MVQALKPWLEKAGSFAVEKIPCHNLGQAVIRSTPPTGVLHTTEGWWGPSLAEFRKKFAPHFIVGLDDHKKPAIAQLVPVGTMGAACRAHNNLALVQVEMVAFSKDKPWLPDAGTLEAIASLMLACRNEYGIALSHPWPDGDFGRAGHNPHRSAGKLGHVGGWFGHGDMPDPDEHWDPGCLEWSKIFARAEEIRLQGMTPPAKPATPKPVTPPAKPPLVS